MWIGGVQLLTALFALAAIRLSKSLLPPEQYGVLALLVTFQVFCGLFSSSILLDNTHNP